MKRENADIRTAAQQAGVRLWEVAESLHIADATLSRKLRRELPQPEKERILSIIDDLKTKNATR